MLKNPRLVFVEGIKATIIPHSYKDTVVKAVVVMIPISVPVPAGYVAEPAIFLNIVIVDVRAMFEVTLFTIIEAVSPESEEADTQPV